MGGKKDEIIQKRLLSKSETNSESDKQLFAELYYLRRQISMNVMSVSNVTIEQIQQATASTAKQYN